MTELQSVFRINGPSTVTASTSAYRYFVDCAGATVNLTLPLTKLNGMHLNILRNDSVVGGTLNVIPNTGASINRGGIGVPVDQPNLSEFEYSNIGNNWFYGINPGSSGSTGDCQTFGNTAILDAPGSTFVVPDGICTLYIQMWGGGGGGAGGNGTDNGGGGGGGGGFLSDLVPNVAGSSITFIVGGSGAGGATATSGGAGGNTSYTISGNTRTAGGGGGGLSNGGQGGGGVSSGGVIGFTITVDGDPGGQGDGGGNPPIGGNGGSAPFGGGGGLATNDIGGNGDPPGGGGAGGSNNFQGGSGAAGQVVIRY